MAQLQRRLEDIQSAHGRNAKMELANAFHTHPILHSSVALRERSIDVLRFIEEPKGLQTVHKLSAPIMLLPRLTSEMGGEIRLR